MRLTRGSRLGEQFSQIPVARFWALFSLERGSVAD